MRQTLKLAAKKISAKNFVWLILINLVFLQNPLFPIIPLMRYFDELLTLFFMIFIAFNMRRLRREHVKIFIYLFSIIVLGLISNFSSDISRPLVGIVLDILYFGKIYICLIGASLYFQKKGGIRDLTRLLAVELHIFVVIGLLLAFVSQFLNIGMTYDNRFGFKNFKYIYSSPGMFS